MSLLSIYTPSNLYTVLVVCNMSLTDWLYVSLPQWWGYSQILTTCTVCHGLYLCLFTDFNNLYTVSWSVSVLLKNIEVLLGLFWASTACICIESEWSCPLKNQDWFLPVKRHLGHFKFVRDLLFVGTKES